MFAYCLNNPIALADFHGNDAILVIYPNAAAGFGHTSALIQAEDGTWYFFYYGPVSETFGIDVFYGDSNVYYTQVTLDGCLNGDGDIDWDVFASNNTEAFSDNKRLQSQLSGYRTTAYFAGDFSASVDYMLSGSLEKTKYSVLLHNCAHTTIGLLLMGERTPDLLRLAKNYSQCLDDSFGIAIPNVINAAVRSSRTSLSALQ